MYVPVCLYFLDHKVHLKIVNFLQNVRSGLWCGEPNVLLRDFGKQDVGEDSMRTLREVRT